MREARRLQPNIFTLIITGHTSRYPIEDPMADGTADIMFKPFHLNKPRTSLTLAKQSNQPDTCRPSDTCVGPPIAALRRTSRFIRDFRSESRRPMRSAGCHVCTCGSGMPGSSRPLLACLSPTGLSLLHVGALANIKITLASAGADALRAPSEDRETA
jgi:hypothetical protein